MRVLLTGPKSFSGSVILNFLLKRGYDVTTISRSLLPEHISQQVHCIYADLAQIKELPGSFDAVIHIAATSPSDGITDNNLIHDNIVATQNLIDICKKATIAKFIFFSTLSVYGEVTQSEITENTPIVNPCTYGASKLMCEAMLRAQQDFSVMTIRLPAVIGHMAARHWLANTILKAKSGFDINIFNPNASFNNAVHIESLAEFVDSLLRNKFLQHFDIVNVASAGGMTIEEIVNKIIVSLKSQSKIKVGTAGKTPFTISTEHAVKNYSFAPWDFSEAFNKYLTNT